MDTLIDSLLVGGAIYPLLSTFSSIYKTYKQKKKIEEIPNVSGYELYSSTEDTMFPVYMNLLFVYYPLFDKQMRGWRFSYSIFHNKSVVYENYICHSNPSEVFYLNTPKQLEDFFSSNHILHNFPVNLPVKILRYESIRKVFAVPNLNHFFEDKNDMREYLFSKNTFPWTFLISMGTLTGSVLRLALLS